MGLPNGRASERHGSTARTNYTAWFRAEKGRVHRDVYAMAEKIELATAWIKQRHATLYKAVNGEDAPVSFGFWMTRLAQAVISSVDNLYRRPYINVISAGASFMENRIGTTKAIVQISPSDASFRTRDACKQVTSYVDALFDECDVYDTQQETYRDRVTFGMSYVKVVANAAGDGVDISRPLPSEILVDPTVRGKPYEMIQVCFMPRDALRASFGNGKISAEVDRAIESAPLAYQQPNNLISEVVVLLEAWHRPAFKGDKGRHVLVLPNADLLDEEWDKDHFPFVMRRYKKQSVGYYSNGPAFDTLPYQIKVNELTRRIDEGHEASMGYWVSSDPNLQAKNFGARPRALIKATAGVGTVEFVTPQTVHPEIYGDLERRIKLGLEHGFGITAQQTSGEKPSGVNSGKGLRLALQIEDSRHKADTLNIEQEAKEIAELAIEVAEEINLKVTTSGIDSRALSWKDLGIRRNKFQVTVFPVSSLSLSAEDRAEEIEARRANGVIDNRTYQRLLSYGDTAATDRYATADMDLIESQLDDICRSEKFIAPEPYVDPAMAFATAKARWALECRFKSSRKVLRCIAQYMAAAADARDNPGGQFLPPDVPAALPPAAGGMPPPGPGGPGGPALAPSPLQLTPPMAPPAPPDLGLGATPLPAGLPVG